MLQMTCTKWNAAEILNRTTICIDKSSAHLDNGLILIPFVYIFIRKDIKCLEVCDSIIPKMIRYDWIQLN